MGTPYTQLSIQHTSSSAGTYSSPDESSWSSSLIQTDTLDFFGAGIHGSGVTGCDEKSSLKKICQIMHKQYKTKFSKIITNHNKTHFKQKHTKALLT